MTYDYDPEGVAQRSTRRRPWGDNPTLLNCGHLAEPFAGYGTRDGVRIRECWRCRTWQEVVARESDVNGDA